MKNWDNWIGDATKQYGGSAVPPSVSGGRAYLGDIIGNETFSELYKNASPHMRQVAAKEDARRAEQKG